MAEANRFMEEEMIKGPPFQLPAHGIARPDDRWGENYATSEHERVLRLGEWGFSKERAQRFVLATEYIDMLPVLAETLRRAGITDDEFFDSGQEFLTEFIELMPTRAMFARLRVLAFQNRSHRWHPHDLNDMVGVSMGAAYCDVVVGEKQWIDYARRSGRARAALLDSLTDLPVLLAAA